MKPLPNPSVPLVATDGRPTSVLMKIVPTLMAVDVVVDRQGQPTPLFISRLQGMTKTPPSPRAQLVNGDGTPTRFFTAILGEI